MRGVLAQEIHHRVKNNLQTVASLLRLQARAEGVDPREALEHSVNRILAIAAVHEALTEQREEDVELAELSTASARCSSRDRRGDATSRRELEQVSLAGTRATALALVFSELLQNALEHGAGRIASSSRSRDGDVVLAIADEGAGADGAMRRDRPLDRPGARRRRAPRQLRADTARAPRSCSRREDGRRFSSSCGAATSSSSRTARRERRVWHLIAGESRTARFADAAAPGSCGRRPGSTHARDDRRVPYVLDDWESPRRASTSRHSSSMSSPRLGAGARPRSTTSTAGCRATRRPTLLFWPEPAAAPLALP